MQIGTMHFLKEFAHIPKLGLTLNVFFLVKTVFRYVFPFSCNFYVGKLGPLKERFISATTTLTCLFREWWRLKTLSNVVSIPLLLWHFCVPDNFSSFCPQICSLPLFFWSANMQFYCFLQRSSLVKFSLLIFFQNSRYLLEKCNFHNCVCQS